MATCRSCGAEVIEGVEICPSCGTRIETPNESGFWRVPDLFTLLRWLLINLPYATAALLVGLYYYYIRDFGQGLGTIFGILVFVLLFVIPFYIGEKANKLAPPLNMPVRFLHFISVTGVPMVLAFLIVLTVLVKDHVDPDVLPEVPVSERLESFSRALETDAVPETDATPEPGEESAVPSETEAVEDVEDVTLDVFQRFARTVLDRAEITLVIVQGGDLARFPVQVFISVFVGLAVGFLSWVTYRKRPWKVKIQEVNYSKIEEPSPHQDENARQDESAERDDSDGHHGTTKH